jgi:hypothetical protein
MEICRQQEIINGVKIEMNKTQAAKSQQTATSFDFGEKWETSRKASSKHKSLRKISKGHSEMVQSPILKKNNIFNSLEDATKFVPSIKVNGKNIQTFNHNEKEKEIIPKTLNIEIKETERDLLEEGS